MRKVFLIVSCLAVAAVVPAQAKSPKPDHPANSHKCRPHNSGYNARGTLVTVALLIPAKRRFSLRFAR